MARRRRNAGAAPLSRLRVLSLSTLFPSPARPSFGRFVANQMRAAAATAEVDLVMVNPIGIPPWPLTRREPYRSLAATASRSSLAGVEVYHPLFRLVPKLGGDSNPARIVEAVLPLAQRLHARAPFDLVDAQFFFPDGPAAAAIAGELGVPLTIKARGSDIHVWGARPRALSQMLEAASAAARLLTVSAALGRDMAALGMDPGKIAVHYTGLDRQRFQPRPREAARAAVSDAFGIPEDAPLLVCPGALIAIKGQRLAIEAITMLDARLALAGTGPDADELEARAKERGVSDRVHLLGQVGPDDLATLLAAARVVVLPSEREGLANVWIEALACGTPLVIPNIGGAREVVVEPSAGRLADRNPEAIARAIREVLSDNAAPRDVARNAARFSWQANGTELVRLWQEAAAY